MKQENTKIQMIYVLNHDMYMTVQNSFTQAEIHCSFYLNNVVIIFRHNLTHELYILCLLFMNLMKKYQGQSKR